MYVRLVKLLTLFVTPAILSPVSRTGDKIAGATLLLLSWVAVVVWQRYPKTTHRSTGSANTPNIRNSLVALACRTSHEDIQSRTPNSAEVAFNVRLLVLRCTLAFAGRARSKNLRLKTAVDADVPRLVRADRSRILHVLTNLLDNAVKFTGEGVVRLEVRCAIEGGRPLLRFTVYDTGAGIDSDSLARILGPHREIGAPGHGLFVSQRVIASMGGTLGAESEPRGGSTFWFSVPVEIIQPAPKPVPQSSTPARAPGYTSEASSDKLSLPV